MTLPCAKLKTELEVNVEEQWENNTFPFHLFLTQAIQSLFPRLPDSGRGTSLFDRGTAAAAPEGDKLRLDAYPFLSSGEFKY